MFFIVAEPSGYPKHIIATAVNSTTLEISWNPPPIEDHNGVIVDYFVRLTSFESEIAYELVTGGALSLMVTGLHPFYTYNYIIAAATLVGRGPFSVSKSIKMPPDGE